MWVVAPFMPGHPMTGRLQRLGIAWIEVALEHSLEDCSQATDGDVTSICSRPSASSGRLKPEHQPWVMWIIAADLHTCGRQGGLGMLNSRLGPTPSFACASLLAQVWCPT